MKSGLLWRITSWITCILLMSAAYSFANSRSLDYIQNPAIQQKVSGIVTNEKGTPLVGVTVAVKGTSNGTVTDAKGKFTLSNVSDNAALVVSYIGYETQEVMVNGRSNLKIELKQSSTSLNQLVVVGYGTEKKVDLTGAVQQISGKVLENRPMPNIERGLEGVIPNLTLKFIDGKPSRSNAMNVRGVGSIGAGGSALVLIDGVPGDPSNLNPNDIASISVLEDAAASAIYGSRGAFGVVLITTKKAKKGKVQINYSASYSINDRTVKPKLLTNGYLWAKNFDSAYASRYDYQAQPQKVNSVFPFSVDYLDALKQHEEDPSLPKIDVDPATGNYVYYGNTDWQKLLFSTYNPSVEHDLSISGGSDKVDYYISGRYYYQKGIFRDVPNPYKMYNLRAKGSIQVFPWLKVGDNMSFYRKTYREPLVSQSNTAYTSVFRRISDEFFPIAMLRNLDGTLTNNAAITLGSFYTGSNYMTQTWTGIENIADFSSDFIHNRLSVNGNFTFSVPTYIENHVNTYVPYSTGPGKTSERGTNRLNEENDNTTYTGANIYASYQQTFGKHSLKAMIGYEYEHLLLQTRYFEKFDLINPALPDFSLANGQDFTITGGGSEWTTIGTFFRVNYNYADKYLLEINGRYDGTSKFPTNQQFGIFPSVSAGWRISQEPFWKVSKNFISNLKLRASFGTLGNGNIAPYQFLETMSVNKLGRIIDGTNPEATQDPNVIPNGLTWEKATTADVGLDIGFLNYRFNVTTDVYNRYTTGMFTPSMPLPGVFGAGVPKGNYADLKTQGFELTVDWQDQFNLKSKPFHYELRFVLSNNETYITKYNNPNGLITTYYKGEKLDDIWGFVNDGYFTSEEDIKNSPNQSFVIVSAGNHLLPGDIKFKDLNHDGKINEGDETLSNHGDLKIIGNNHAQYLFGFSANADWNNFFFSAFFQGVGKRDWYFGSESSLFWGQYNRPYSWEPVAVYENQWSPEKPNAYFPRLRGYSALISHSELTFPQTKYLQNAAYIRLKSISVGYNLPHSLISKVGLTDARVYLSGQNIWVWSPMYKIMKTFDPEVIEESDPDLTSNNQGDGMDYPMLKTYTVGLNITF